MILRILGTTSEKSFGGPHMHLIQKPGQRVILLPRAFIERLIINLIIV